MEEAQQGAVCEEETVTLKAVFISLSQNTWLTELKGPEETAQRSVSHSLFHQEMAALKFLKDELFVKR